MAKSYLRFWGVRGSYASPFPTHLKVGGNTSCVEINVDDHVLICDAGTGIIPLGNKLAAQGNSKNLLIILTHYHWDHICGLPFFVPAFILLIFCHQLILLETFPLHCNHKLSKGKPSKLPLTYSLVDIPLVAVEGYVRYHLVENFLSSQRVFEYLG